jgi:hypothetical protein
VCEKSGILVDENVKMVKQLWKIIYGSSKI